MASLQEKQKYLYKQIIDCNEDPEDFQDYMEANKGLDLDLYTMEELKAIVKTFKADPEGKGLKPTGNEANHMGPAHKQQQQSSRRMQIQEPSEYAETIPQKAYSINSSTKNVLNYTEKVVLPQLYQAIHVNHKAIEVKVRSYSKKQSDSLFKMFQSKYIVYLVETSNGWAVKRRFNEFSWLYNCLQTKYPGFPVPPIPSKTTYRSFDENHLQNRMIMFQKFLNKLLRIPELCSDPIVESFLSLNDANQFQKFKQLYDNELSSKPSGEIISLKGDQLLNYDMFQIPSKDRRHYERNIEIMHGLTSQLSNLQSQMNSLISKCFQISTVFSSLATNSKQKSPYGGQVFNVMGDFISQIGTKLQHELLHIKGYMYSHCNYQYHYNHKILSEINLLSKDKQAIESKNKDLMAQSLQSDDSELENKYMKSYLKSKELYRVKLSFLASELNRHEEEDLKAIAKEWASSMRSYMDVVKNYMLSGADQLTKAICISEGKNLVEVEYIKDKYHSTGKLPPSLILETMEEE